MTGPSVDLGGPAATTELSLVKHADVGWLRGGVLKQLNSTIQRVSSFFGDQFVDICSSGVGHDACQPAEQEWGEGLCGGAGDYWPATAGRLNRAVVGKRATLVHPGAAGHEDVADRVE
ncbi:hypothetical protein ACWEPZ_27625 [Streptomyces sp. NPDC004288]